MFIKLTAIKHTKDGYSSENGNLYVQMDQIAGFSRGPKTPWLTVIYLKGGQTIEVAQSVLRIREALGLI